MDTRLNLTTFEHFGTARDASENARQAAVKRFDRALATARRRQLTARLFGRDRALKTLDRHSYDRKQAHSTRIQSVPLHLIAGSESRSEDFDLEFLPLKSHLQDRWAGIAAARRQGIPLPPVELVEDGGRYYVRDGHHRISVAMVMGQVEIEARIVS